MSQAATSAPEKLRPKRDWTTAGLALWALLVYVFLFLPIGFVIAHSFNDNRSFLVWGGFSTQPYHDLVNNTALRTALGNSLKVAIGSTILAVILGGLAGVALARRGGNWVRPFMAIVFLVLVTPEIVDAIAYLIWFVRLGEVGGIMNVFDSGYVRMWIGHSVFSSAVVTLIVRARLAGLDDSLEEAAADLGATPARAFRQITLPLMAPALIAGGLLSFTFSLDNTVVSSFVATSGTTTFPVYVFGALRSVLRPDIGAAATLLFLLTLVSLFLVALVLRRSGDSAEQVAATLTGN